MNRKQLISILTVYLIFAPLYSRAGEVTVSNDSGKPTVAVEATIPVGKQYDYSNILVTKVIDGDTLKIESGESVRLIGIDTPVSRMNSKLKKDAQRTGQDAKTITAMGKEAAKFTKQLVEGKRVRLEFDVGKRDKYGRLLAYVYVLDQFKNLKIELAGGIVVVGDDPKNPDLFLNATIVSSGYAQPMTIPPNVKHAEEFQWYYREARGNKRGLWK